MQQSEELLEAKRYEKLVQSKKLEKEINDLTDLQVAADQKILRSTQDHNALQNLDQDNQVDSLPDDLEKSIMELTKELYMASKSTTLRQTDPDYQKLQNMSKVNMLNEVEQMIN